MKSKIYLISSFTSYIKNIVNIISNDKIAVYAAQASFFVITSSVPFISLLIALAGLLLPDNINLSVLNFSFVSGGDSGVQQAELNNILYKTINELKTAPSVSLVSFSAVTTLWTASRGISAIRSGIETVYAAERNTGFVRHKLKSIFLTLMFIVMLTCLTVLLLFGDLLTSFLGDRFSDVAALMRTPLLALIMAVFFTAMYASVAFRSSVVEHNIIFHIPGALFSAVGWLVFSYFYSLYISHFPGASKVYGGLAAICLIMLWLYFCMLILLLGAELNKIYFAGLKERKTS